MDLNEVAIFLKVVQLGSFSQAARSLGMPNSTVSSKISSLEARLGTTLIQRTTRKLHITAAGETFYKRCLLGLEAIQSAEAELQSGKSEPQGLLRITAPSELGSSILSTIISTYTQKYAKTCIETILTDRKVDLLAEGVDLAIRAGTLKDSTLIAKRVGSVYFVPLASPRYLKNRNLPAHPKDLQQHRTLHFTALHDESWTMNTTKQTHQATIHPHVTSNDLTMLKNMVLSGEGIAFLPTYFVINEVQSGKLVRLLPEWRSSLTPVHFVYPSQKFVGPNLSAFISMGADAVKKYFENCEI